jgi:hypothetical protein
MGKALEVFEKTCKKGKACGNACISALKNCASKKTGESTKETGKSTKKTGESTKETGKSTKETGKSTKETGKSTKETGKSTKETGESTKKTGESTQPTKTTPISYKVDSSDHKALMNIGKDFSDQTMGKALKAYEDAQAEKKNFFMDIETNNKKTKKGEWFKKDEKHAAKLDEKMLLAAKEFEAAAGETLQRIASHHKIDRKDAKSWASVYTYEMEDGENKELIRNSLTDVYMVTGGRGRNRITDIELDPSTDRSYAQPKTGKIVFAGAGEPSRGRLTIFHEYAHFMEYENPQLAFASRKFIEDQATSSEPARLKDITGENYRDHEMAFPGNFIHPYVGKIYGPAGEGTEVISMGVEQFTDPKRMSEFYKRDPEHFNFILGAILHEN